MGQMIRIVKEEIVSLFADHPLSFLTERDVVSEFHRRLLLHYPEDITLTVKTVTERFRSIQPTKFISKRVHQEVATEGMGRGKRVDIVVLKDGEAELVGYNYRPGIPSTIVRDQDVVGAIEVKFFRDTDVRPKILRASEVKSYEESINKLGIIKRRNPGAFCAFVVFSHCCFRFSEDQEKRLAHLIKSAKLDLVFRTDVASFEAGTV